VSRQWCDEHPNHGADVRCINIPKPPKQTTASSGGGAASVSTVARKLATVDSGGFVAQTDPMILTYAIPLGSLVRQCHDRPIQIADETIVAQRLLAQLTARSRLEVAITASQLARP
jgi:hypothetical protein